jgi:sugar fermentation stimulation protein A
MSAELQRATFLRRYRRFLADIRWDDGRVETVHCPNSGSMRSLLTPETPCLVQLHDDPRRKLRGTLVLLGLPSGNWALVDTQRPNAIVAAGITAGAVPELAGYERLRREVAYGHEGSRIDLLLESDNGRPPCYVEVKSVTQRLGDEARADFPDAVSERGAKHLRELAALARSGIRAVQFYLVDRSDCTACGIAADIDPAYATALHAAVADGVEVLAYRADVSPAALAVGRACPFVMPALPVARTPGRRRVAAG